MYDGLCLLFINVGIDICTSHKILQKSHKWCTLELWQLRKTIAKKKKRISSPMFLPPKNAELIFCRSHWLSKSWYSKRLRDGSMDKLLATVRTKFISSRCTKMLSGYGHSHVILPADAKFLLQLRNLPLRQDTEWSKKIPDTYFMPVHTYTYTYTHVLPHTWKHMAAVNQNTQTCAKKLQLRTVSTTK